MFDIHFFDTYIFDLYGTLVDIHTNEKNPQLWKKLSLYMTLQGAAYTPAELKKAYLDEILKEKQKNYQKALSIDAQITPEEIEVDFHLVISALYQAKGITPNETRSRDWAVLFRTLSMRHLSLYPGAKELLISLRNQNKKVYLLSNAQRLFTEPEMRSLGIYDLFDDILYSSDIGFTKPCPLFYRSLLEKHQIKPETAVMVGNDDQADCWGAHRMGLASIYIQTAQSPKLFSPLPENCVRIQKISEVDPSESASGNIESLTN